MTDMYMPPPRNLDWHTIKPDHTKVASTCT